MSLTARAVISAGAAVLWFAAAGGETLQAQGPVSPDSADAIRASLQRPPATPGFDAVDAIGLPVRIAVLPIQGLGVGIAWGLGKGTELIPEGPGLLDLLRSHGVLISVGSFGPRSGFGGTVRYEGLSPLYAETSLSVRGSQRHRIGLLYEPNGNSYEASYRFLRNAEPHFWGVGPDTDEENESDYLWDQQEVGLRGEFDLGDLGLSAGAAWEDNRIGRGLDGDEEDLQDTAPPGLFGLNQRGEYIRFDVGTTLDFTHAREFQIRGLDLGFASSLYLGIDGNGSDFHSFDIVARGYAPLNPRQLLAVQVLTEMRRGDSGGGVPFYHLAKLGDEHGARSLKSYRYRDNDMAAVMIEWRYEVWRELHERLRAESFVFFDTGSVADRLADISSDDLAYSAGFGFRAAARPNTLFTTYIAFGTEGPRFQVTFGTVF